MVSLEDVAGEVTVLGWLGCLGAEPRIPHPELLSLPLRRYELALTRPGLDHPSSSSLVRTIAEGCLDTQGERCAPTAPEMSKILDT